MSWSTLSRHISFLVLHLLTFLAIIHLQNQILSPITVTVKALAATSISETSEEVATTIDFQFNEFNSTRTISTLSPPATTSTSSLRQPGDNKISLLSGKLSSLPSMVLSKNAFLLPPSLTQSTAATAATTLPLQDRKLSVVMNSNQLLNARAHNSSIQPFNSATVSTSTGNSSSKVSSIQYANSQTLDFMSTDDHVTLPFKSMKSISSKFPLELAQSKFVWTKSDAVNSTAVTAGAQTAAAAAALRLVTEKPRILRINNNKHHHEHHWGPFFEEPLSSTASGDNIITTAHLFTEAILNCRVGMLKDKTVMWVRRTAEKVSLLTVGNVTYSSDPRIRVKFQYPNNWRLLINPTQWDDAGIYMCQVSTHPPRVFTTNLTIIEPPLRLIDEQERDVGDRYYKTGSTIDLQCQISRSFLHKEKQNILKSLMPLNINATTASSAPSRNMKMLLKEKSSDEAPKVRSSYNDLLSSSNPMLQSGIPLEKQFSSMVFWSKDDEQLPTTAFRRISTDDKWFTSRTSITDAKLSDSGNYSCSIGRLFTAIVQVQVLTGESPAAVQHNSGCRMKTGVGAWQQLWKIYLTTALHLLKLSSYNN